MKKILIKILRWTLKILSNLIIWKYDPKIIGVTGSVGKTSTKMAIYTILSHHFKTRVSYGNLNNDLGLPLAILGDFSENELKLVSKDTKSGEKIKEKILFWIKVILQSIYQIIFKNKNYPEILVLEYGADRPGDIKYLLKIAKPQISVITAIGEIPVHVEFYNSPEELALEKSNLIVNLHSSNLCVLNYDDVMVTKIKHRTRAKIVTFGFNSGADIQILNFENKIENGKLEGIVFKIQYENRIIPFKIKNVFGKSYAYSVSAAIAVGMHFGINLITIAQDLESYKPIGGRANLISGIKNTLIIDDAYNASLLSMSAALDLLKDLPAKRKIAVLGDMLELGKYSIIAHEKIGQIVPQAANILITVGPRSKLIAETARKNGLKSKNILTFNTVEEVFDPLIELIKPGDLILIKASHGIRLYELVDALKSIS
ncbi:MAG: UDP-N-acetylmuramoyl-tripeptide--D-alanyl-D-alanine ligase [bacterium]|nr:UDP-N-acetylmuramoyl-tripeptide--D-alanyl-D-alanine ligase [Patescibacteria group bacterium]MDW8279838.1 UDP-N-acetylmuramoyl-tripeptide--D-alanyl-D-alanine ligase [bacterium]